MDEQNPRVTADDLRGRGDEAAAGYGEREPRRAGSLDEAATTRTREIRAEIAQTRGELSETVDAIQDRLRPSNLASQAASSVKEAALDKAHEVAESEPVIYVRANPIPTAMVGIGLIGATWLALGGRDGRSRGYGSRGYGYGQTTSSSWRRRYPDSADYRTDRTPLERPRARADYASSETPRSAVAYRGSAAPRTSGLRRAWNANPLLIGAAAALAGAVVGLSVPETEREHQLMGEARDAMLDTVQETVRDKVDQVQQAASDAVNTVQKIATGESRSSG